MAFRTFQQFRELLHFETIFSLSYHYSWISQHVFYCFALAQIILWLVVFFTTLQTIEITNNILDVADRFLLTDQEVLEKSNEDNNTSATFLRNLDVLAVILTNQSTNQTVFRRQNIALAIRNKSSSFTFIAEDKNNLLDIQTADGEITNQASLAKVFIPQSLLIKAGSNQVYSFVFRSGLLFSDPLENETVQSIIMSASVPERKIYNLSDPVVITFQDQNANKTIKNKISTCQFWVPERKGICAVSDFIFLWSAHFYRKFFKSIFFQPDDIRFSLESVPGYLDISWKY